MTRQVIWIILVIQICLIIRELFIYKGLIGHYEIRIRYNEITFPDRNYKKTTEFNDFNSSDIMRTDYTTSENNSVTNVKLSANKTLCIDKNYNLCDNTSNSNVFIRYVKYEFVNQTKSNTEEPPFHDILSFSGNEVKRLFDPNGLMYGVSLNGKSRVRQWSDVAHLINESAKLQISRNPALTAIHVHNELKIGDFLQLILNQVHSFNKQNKLKNKVVSAQDLLSAFDLGQLPIVLTNTADENWGALSTPIGTRTTKWINMTNHLLIHGANYDIMHYFLNCKKLLLFVCNTHVDPQIGAHEKILSLPLGIKSKERVFNKIIEFVATTVNKTRLLLINNSGWQDRSKINGIVSQAFDRKVYNTYDRTLQRDHYRDVAESMFVLSPSGLGFDTYRLWETLLLGSIPIVESNAGFDRTYSHLPVLVVQNYSDVSPGLLKRIYSCFVNHASEFRYNHLRRSYWVNLIETAINYGNIDYVNENHPFSNHFCRYQDYMSD